MSLNIGNFAQSTLRAPIQPTDNVLQLAIGGGAAFNFSVGDYCFITLQDRLNTEVVRYTSTGPVMQDNLVVVRGQDGTVATAFPTGTCVKVAWNEQQVKDLIAQCFATLSTVGCPPSDTQIVPTVPVGAPAGCIRFALVSSTTPWSMYYWTGGSSGSWQRIGDAGLYTGAGAVKIDPATKVVSLQLGQGLTTAVSGLTVKLDVNSGLTFNAAGELTIDCAKLSLHCPLL